MPTSIFARIRANASLDVFARDVRVGLRSLLRTPSFTATAVIALALGIGANTAILSVVDAVLLRPLGYADADRLVVILHDGRAPVSPPNFADWRARTTSFSDMAAAELWSPNLTSGDSPEHLNALRLSGRMFPMLGVQPLLGRVFTESDDVAGSDNVVVISYGLWQRRFGGDVNIVGKSVQLEARPYTILGVMPRGFQFAPFWATKAELWAPLSLGVRTSGSRGANSLRVFARLRANVTLDRARSDIATVTNQLEQTFPGTNRNLVVVPLKQRVVGDVRTPLIVLLAAVSLVLLIACANVAHMLLARAAARARELAVRTALGATRARLIAQLLVESAVLAVAGGLAGLALAFGAVRAIVGMGSSLIPRVADVSVDARILVITLLLTALTAIVFGLLPAVRAARVDLAGTFRDGDRASSEGRTRQRLRNALVASELALALMLLVGAGLMIRSFASLRRYDPGFDPRGVVTMTISLAGTRLAEPSARPAFFAEVLARVRTVPGVSQASFINHLPIAGDQWGLGFRVEGQPTPRPGEMPSAVYRVAFPGYFAAMRTPLVSGRDVDATDRADAPRVVVINERMAKTRWPHESAIGKRILIGSDTTPITVVGVVKNVVNDGWGAASDEELYLPFHQATSYVSNSNTRYAYLTLVARASCTGTSRCDAASLAAPLVAAVRGIERGVPISEVQTMTKIVDGATAESRFYVTLLSAFAAIALMLAAVGIYGVMSYSVSRRTSEIGIRVALGAEPRAVLRFIVRDGTAIAGVGAAVGLLGAFGLTRLMGRLLYGVGPTDPMTFTAVTLVLCAVAFVACYVPARRATRIDPLRALRSE